MEEETILLPLDQAQRAQLFAHLLTYLLCLAMPSAARHGGQENLALVQEVAYRLHQFCLQPDEQIFQLKRKELTAVSATLRLLQPLYEQPPEEEASVFVLEHLAACLSLLQQAELHIDRNEERSERE